jgi:HD-GYP domain-containing protein (c-di-GMP phosphodiesterase class II)
MHLRRVCDLAGELASVLGLSRAARRQAAAAGLFHDVGKSLVPRSILDKRSTLTRDEMQVVRLHPADGAALAASTGDDVVLDAIRHHHERLDGTGYPDGLSAGELADVTRVVAVADVYDALTSHRPYRSGLPPAEAFRRMTEAAGTKLDPEMVDCLVKLRTGVLSRAA